jgi:hypothetical protein
MQSKKGKHEEKSMPVVPQYIKQKQRVGKEGSGTSRLWEIE